MRSELNARVWNDSDDGGGISPPKRAETVLLSGLEEKSDGTFDRVRSIRDLKVNLRSERKWNGDEEIKDSND